MINNRPITAVGIQCSHALSALDQVPADSLRELLCSDQHGLSLNHELLGRPVWVGAYQQPLSTQLAACSPALHSRNLQFAITALQPMLADIQQLTAGIGKQRLAIVLGTSTSGIDDSQRQLAQQLAAHQRPQLDYAKQAMSALAEGVQQYLGWTGLAYSISTACSSSAKAIAAGHRLLLSDLADVVLVGGVDTLCKLTLAGFDSLQSLSASICQPFAAARDGINIGEAAALFVLSRESAAVQLCGWGESMDGWHISAPHPEGRGAVQAMQAALHMAQLAPEQIDYLNLHGTATLQNDAMEAKASAQVFQHPLWVSSTKHKTGHCLGAAGAIEAYICQQILSSAEPWLPWHHGASIDPALAALNYVTPTAKMAAAQYVMSNSFAFGGSNVSLIFSRGKA